MNASLLFLFSATLLLTGCPGKEDDTGDTDTGDTDTGDTDSGDTDSGDTDSGVDVVAFYVTDPNDPELGPVAGVTVAVDTTDGDRLEAVSGADGMVSFEFDPEEFAGAIGHADGRSFTCFTRDSLVDYLRVGEVPWVWSWPLVTWVTAAATSSYPVSGALLNKVDDANMTLVTTSIGGMWNDVGTSYELDVAGGQDFSLVALEWTADADWGDDRVIEEVFHGWVLQEQPAISGPTTVDLDFASPTVPATITGSIAAPDDAVLAEQGAMYVEVWGDNFAFVGGSHSTSPGADGASYDFALEYVELSGLTPTTYVSVWGPDGSSSTAAIEGGMPSNGAQDLDMLAPPRRAAPTGSGPFAWSEPILWSAPVEGQLARYADDFGQIGLVFVGPDEDSYALPPLPSTSTTLGSGSIQATLSGCTSDDEDPQCERSADGDPFSVNSPFAM